MLDFGTWGELLIIAITALIVIGPKDLPKAMRTLGRWVYKFRSISQQVRSYVDDLAFQAQREDIMNIDDAARKNETKQQD